MRKALLAALGALALSGCATVAARPEAVAVPKSYQWLHGSGEAAILARQTFAAMADYVEAAVARKGADGSVVLAPGSTPSAPRWTPCGDRPPAVIFDIDETALLNTGANYDSARRGDPPFDPARWAVWEAGGAAYVDAMPGLAAALARIRAAGVTVVFNSNREARFGAQAADALRGAGLGEAIPGETLLLKGDVAPGSGKDPRRAAVAGRWCVVAMAGDQMGDFADAYNDPALGVQARRRLVETAAASERVGRGWFLLANPVYGPGVRGNMDEVFPADKRWSSPSVSE